MVKPPTKGRFQTWTSKLIVYIRNWLGMKPRRTKEEAYVLYQRLCDEIFGKGVIQIKPVPPNNVIGTLCFLDDFLEFKHNFKVRLIRLRDHFSRTPSYKDLLEQVKLVADPKNWEGAYAELVAYDFMWTDYVINPLQLNITCPATESYAGEVGYKETNEDGYLPDYNLFFDVKILGDTVGEILTGIIQEAIKGSNQKASCDILPEYPLDDYSADYGGPNRQLLLKELTFFLQANNTRTDGHITYKSVVAPQLRYKVHWGGGVNSSMSTYDPYRHAAETKNLIFERYTKKIMKNEPFMLVLVKFPWYNNRISSFIDADHIYYRSMARRTFCGYINDSLPMNVVVPKFNGQDNVYEVSRHLSGIIFIDDNSVTNDSCSCCVMLNPNAVNTNSSMIHYLESLVTKGDNRSLFDDFRYDNY